MDNKDQASTNKNHNKVKILKLIKSSGEISRAELAKRTGLTRPTVSSIISELCEEKLITEIGKGKSSGGKRPILLTLDNDSTYSIGIDLADEYSLRGALCNFGGETLRKEKLSYNNNFDDILDKLSKLIKELSSGYPSEKIKGIGIAVSGIVNHKTNEITHSTNFDIAGKNLAKLIEKRFGLPVYLKNRPNAAALAESIMGAGKAFKNFVYITTGRGLGAGIISNRAIYTGSFGGAGEIGKLILFSQKDFLNKKPEAMLEYKMRESYLLSQAKKAKGRNISYEEVLDLYKRGDHDIESIINENADYLACAASIICNFYNPEALILGGRKKEFGEKYLEYFESIFNKHFANPHTGRTKALLSKFGRDGVAIGGAMLILDKIINQKLESN